MEIDIDPKLEVFVRDAALAAMSREFAYAMGVTRERSLEMILEGVRRRVLGRIEILLFNGEGVDQGCVYFEVDWDRHLMVSSDGKSKVSFEVDLEMNVAEQVAPVVALVESALVQEARDRGVTTRRVVVTYANGASNEDRERFRREFALVPVSEEERRLLDGYRDRYSTFVDGGLEELSCGGSFRKL